MFFTSRNMEGDCPVNWQTDSSCKLVTSQNMNVKLTVNNVLKEIRILNIFGVIKGFEEPGKVPCIFIFKFLSCLSVSFCISVFLTLLKDVARGGESIGELALLWFLEMLNLICPKVNCVGISFIGR